MKEISQFNIVCAKPIKYWIKINIINKINRF